MNQRHSSRRNSPYRQGSPYRQSSSSRRRSSAARRRRQRRQTLTLISALLAVLLLAAALWLWRKPSEPAPPPVPTDTPTPVPAASTPVPEPSAAPVERPWNLRLVNTWNPLPADYVPTLTQLSNGMSVDQRCYSALQDMLDACRAEGLSPVVCSAYRPREEQETLYQQEIDHFLAQGYEPQAAQEEAGRAVAVPGTSEHQLGLALDIVDLDYQLLDHAQEETAVQQWLLEHCWDYGFILRFPNDKSEITGIIYEPWHYRYVGLEAAQEIRELGVCLEEYLDQDTP